MPTDTNPHVEGATYARKTHARYETKAGDDSGAGYPRWRSFEYRPSTPGTRKEDVYVPVHRLLAVVECYPDGMALGDVLAHLDGKDVHHTTGVKWANFGSSPNFDSPGIEVVDHARHGRVTNAQLRAWAADRKSEVAGQDQQVVAADIGTCDNCGAETETLARNPSWDGAICIECTRQLDPEGPVEVVTS